MDKALKQKIIRELAANRVMTIATLRPDGWPQATAVGYANDGLLLYFLCGRDSQKAQNLSRNDRVSITIGHDPDQVMEITGLSMAGHARPVLDQSEAQAALRLLMARYPEQKIALPMPKVTDVSIFRVEPVVVSVLDYAKGFGHTDLVDCSSQAAA